MRRMVWMMKTMMRKMMASWQEIASHSSSVPPSPSPSLDHRSQPSIQTLSPRPSKTDPSHNCTKAGPESGVLGRWQRRHNTARWLSLSRAILSGQRFRRYPRPWAMVCYNTGNMCENPFSVGTVPSSDLLACVELETAVAFVVMKLTKRKTKTRTRKRKKDWEKGNWSDAGFGGSVSSLLLLLIEKEWRWKLMTMKKKTMKRMSFVWACGQTYPTEKAACPVEPN